MEGIWIYLWPNDRLVLSKQVNLNWTTRIEFSIKRPSMKSIFGKIRFSASVTVQFGVEVWKTLTVGPCSQVFSTIQGKTMPSTFYHFALRLYNLYNHTHAPGPHVLQSPGSGPDSKCCKTVEVGCSCYELDVHVMNTQSAQHHHCRNPRKKNYREHSNVKACVPVHWRLSATPNGQGLQRVSTPWAKNCSKNQIKIKACPVNAGHYMAFKHRISFATYLAANFGSDWFRIMPDIIPSFWVQPSEVSMLLYSNLSTCPFLGRDVNLDLLLCTGLDLEHSALFLYHIFTRKPMNDRKIERSYGRCSGRQQLLANSIENFILHVEKKSDPLRPEI